jgi:hypothetical protein
MKNINEMTNWMIFGLAIYIDDELDKVFTRDRLRDITSSKLKGTINTTINNVWVATSVDPVGE